MRNMTETQAQEVTYQQEDAETQDNDADATDDERQHKKMDKKTQAE